jgi:hypothetical protein
MSEIKTGDKVEIIEHPNKGYIGKRGDVIHIGSTPKSVSQAVDVKLPKMESEPYYSVILGDSSEVHNLKQRQLRKL